jgi:two-component system, OmpR family, phosphate regulon sensor histidine kinase PhoR
MTPLGTESATSIDAMGVMTRRPRDPARIASSKIAWTVAGLFFVAGAVWVVLTDILLYRFVHDEIVLARIETAKGWTFVALGAVAMFIVADRKVRKLARSESTTRAVVDSIADGVLLLDRRGAIAMANPAAVRMLGAKRPDELLGLDGAQFARRYQVALPDGHILPPAQYVSQRALTGESPLPYKAVLHPPGRHAVTAMVTGAPVRPVPGGDVELAVSVMHDITQLERIEQMRDEFVSSAAHVLRTPVAIIKAHIELLASDNNRNPWSSMAAIDRQCDRIVRVTENLVVLARLRSNSLRLQNEQLDLAKLVESAASEMYNARADHRLEIEVRVHPTVFGDRERLVIAIRNLIEIAYQRAQPSADVALLLEANGGDANVRIVAEYAPLVSDSLLDEADVDAGFAGLGLERYVTAQLVEATRGVVGSDVAGQRRQDWIELPTIEAAHD